MSYQVIARKYRPQRFADVVGQEHVTTTLANAIAQQRIAHAYLFCGPRGTGKTTIARIFAKCLNCTGGPKVDFTEDDPRCLEIAEGRSLDVLEIDGASNNGVEQVRELRETCRYAPASSRFKIYIIDEVHMLSTAAFNALLKTLEEPPPHVKFMFATTDPERVLPTILSRCQRFDLRRIPSSLIVKHLAQIAAQEAVDIEPPALRAIARGADGGMRDAESTLDQLISFCGNRITEPDVLSMFGLTAQAEVLGLFGAVLDGEPEAALRSLDALCRHGKDLARLHADLMSHGRNVLLFLLSEGNLDLVEASEAEAEALRLQSARVSAAELTRILETLADFEPRLRDASSRRIVLELALLKAIEARHAVGVNELLSQLRRLRGERAAPKEPGQVSPVSRAATPHQASPASPSLAPLPSPVTPPADTPPSPAPPTALPPPGDLGAVWSALLELVGRSSKFVHGYLTRAHLVSLDRNTLVVGFDPEHADQLELVNHDRNKQLLRDRMAELGYPGLQVRFVQAPAPASSPSEVPTEGPQPAAPPPASSAVATPGGHPAAPAKKPKAEPQPLRKEDFKNDPLIQKALEVFKGQIVEARG